MRAATSRPRLECENRSVRWSAAAALATLGSLKLSLAVLTLLGAGALATLRDWVAPTWALALPFTLMAVNLGAAVSVRGVFRRNVPLLVFHLGLIAIALLAAVGRLTYLEGTVEIASGDRFDGTLSSVASGPWHSNTLAAVAFGNEGFRVEYDEYGRRLRTHNAVLWQAADGAFERSIIGENRPLSLHGYRFTPTSNKGYAPAFAWIPNEGGVTVLGRVHLPSYPANEYRQARTWQVGAMELWAMLQIDETMMVPGYRSEFRLPSRHRVIIHAEGERHELRPGDRVVLSHGTLVYRGLETWMGYVVRADWTPPWLTAAGLVSVLSLALHFLRKFRARPWLPTDDFGVPPASAPAGASSSNRGGS